VCAFEVPLGLKRLPILELALEERIKWVDSLALAGEVDLALSWV